MAELLPPTTTAANSADFTVAVGTPVRISLFNAAGGQLANDAFAFVEYKASNNQYFGAPEGGLDSFNQSLLLSAPGTYRVRKGAAAVAFGVDKD